MKKYTFIVLIFFASILSAQVMRNEMLGESTPPINSKFLSDQLIIQGLYIRTLGNFNEVWSSGTGAYLNYGMYFPDHNTLNFQIGYINYSLRDGLDTELDTLGITDTKLFVIPLLVGGKYFFTDSRFMPYFSFMNGINIINETFGFTIETDAKGNEIIQFENTGDQTLVRYAWQVGIGIMVNLVSSLNVDLAVKYNSHFYHTESMNTGFEYGFGLVWSINN
jgi:hypothetical protein